MLIDCVRITGFWKKHTITARLHRDVNIFIGRNGSGKTTLLDMLLGALRADTRLLSANGFKTIDITLRSEKDATQTLDIEIERSQTDSPIDRINYKIGSRSWTIPAISEPETLYRSSPVKHQEWKNLQETLSHIVQIGSLSVHRSPDATKTYDPAEPRSRRAVSPIDARVRDITAQLTKFRLELSERSEKVGANFQKEVMKSILYDEDFDKPDFEDLSPADLDDARKELTNAYAQLEANDEVFAKRLDRHFEALRECIDEIERGKEKGHWRSNIIFALPLLKRTQYITSLSVYTEGEKRAIFAPLHDYYSTMSEFMFDKGLLGQDDGPFAVTRDGAEIGVEKLSSGEKQLFVLLSEALLQRNQPYIFIADEPELSLHIEWQAKILQAIRKLNSNSQLIVATHSPEIAAGLSEHLLDMREVFDV